MTSKRARKAARKAIVSRVMSSAPEVLNGIWCDALERAAYWRSMARVERDLLALGEIGARWERYTVYKDHVRASVRASASWDSPLNALAWRERNINEPMRYLGSMYVPAAKYR